MNSALKTIYFPNKYFYFTLNAKQLCYLTYTIYVPYCKREGHFTKGPTVYPALGLANFRFTVNPTSGKAKHYPLSSAAMQFHEN